jgi:peptidoglycan/xylan/chitin deacetylase (PgdA/CDA1 family)
MKNTMLIQKTVWPNNKSCAALISVNLDAEFFARIYYPDADVNDGDILRLGRTSIDFGLPRLLDVLEQYEVKATFFVPGAVAKRYSGAIKNIAARGHEIGCHGNDHEILAIMPIEEQRLALREARDVIARISGKNPVGFRMPEGEISEETLALVKSLGFVYSSSLSDDDVPYVRKTINLLEIPIHWELFDLPYFVFTFDPPIPPGQARSARMDDVLQNWLYELEGARRWGTLLNLQIDPQATGEQGRIFILEKLLDEIQRREDVWIATGEEIAAYFNTGLK